VVVVEDENREQLPRFTPEEYAAYKQAPQWARDGFDSETEYTSHWCTTIKTWHDESEQAFSKEKQVWDICYDAYESSAMKLVGAASVLEDEVARFKIPVMKNAALDEIAALYAGPYQPVVKALSESAKQMAALANQYIGLELKLNSFDGLKFDLGLDGFITDLWVMKIYTTDEDPGPFDQPEKIVLERIDPRNCFWDPKAKRMHWPLMDFFLVQEEVDLGVARNRFKDKAALIDEALTEPDTTKSRWSSRLQTLPGQRKGSAGQERKKVHIKECWLHDDRMVFRPYIDETETGTELRVNDEGYVEGDWERAYPYGRMIVTASDKVILADCANPFWHKELPFVFCKLTPSTKLISVGKAAAILGIERKINDTETRVHSYMQAETERPMQAEVGALPTNLAWYKTTGQSRNILLLNPGKMFVRPQPVETPAFLVPYLGRLMYYRDETAGQGGLKGKLPDNMAGDAVQAIQAQTMSRQSMQVVMIAQAMREAGEKLFWTIRETYPEGISAKIYTPDGKEVDAVWDEKAIDSAFFVNVDVASNVPGGQQAAANQAVFLWDKKLVDQAYVLPTLQIDGWEQIIQRMQEKRSNDIFMQGLGRSLGLQLKEAQKGDEKSGNQRQM
jgi:hypothetical protein